MRDSEIFRRIFRDLRTSGKLVSPRGQLVLEMENCSYRLPPYVRFQSFRSRKLNLKYCRTEFLWYLRGDRMDTSICDHAKIWKDIVNADGSINSNYGQYIFWGPDNQFDSVVNELTIDRDSRRASMVILSKEHLLSSTKDVPCTYALNFRIREGKLNMSVVMRSQDAIFGMGNDAPCFSFVHEMVLNALKVIYPSLECGEYFHHANSFHAYQRHFELIDKIIEGDVYDDIECPRISGPEEVVFLRKLDFTNIPEDFKFTKWMVSE